MRLQITFAVSVVISAGPLHGLAAQQPGPAAETITAADVARHIDVIAADSMQGRETPSRGLEMTAQYVASQFAKLGLEPAGEDGTWFERFAFPPQIDFGQSRVVFAAGDRKATADFTTTARLVRSSVPGQMETAGVLIVSGRHTTASLEKISGREKIILYVPPPASALDDQSEVIDQLIAGNKGVVVLSDEDSATFARRHSAALRRPIIRVDPGWAVSVRPEAVPGLRDILVAGGVDLERARGDSTPVVRELPATTATFDPRLAKPIEGTPLVNTVGIIPGNDSVLAEEYVIISAHMDGAGRGQGQAGPLGKGANDNASGVAGLIELAKAFKQAYKQLGTGPRRSILFVATSGGAAAQWGAFHFAGRVMTGEMRQMRQTWGDLIQLGNPGRGIEPITAIADIDLDMIGSTPGDSIAVAGINEVELPTPLPWIAAAHSELGLTVGDGGTASTARSDHFWVYRKGVPALLFHNGLPANGHGAAAADTVNAEQEARILRLVFYVAHELANTVARPRWTKEGRQLFLESRRP